MKIPQSVINKFELSPSITQVGQSFINGQMIYDSNHRLMNDWLVMECDFNGEPTEYITLFEEGKGKWYQTTVEFLEETEVELVLATIVNYC